MIDFTIIFYIFLLGFAFGAFFSFLAYVINCVLDIFKKLIK